jgi:hypothetical protein
LFPGIPNKREFLARAFGRLGVLGLLEHAVAAWRPGLVVLTYHRIAEPGAGPFYDPVISATPESFCTQIDWLRNHVNVAPAFGGCPLRRVNSTVSVPDSDETRTRW